MDYEKFRLQVRDLATKAYTFEDAEMLCIVLKDEVRHCEKRTKKRNFHALA